VTSLALLLLALAPSLGQESAFASGLVRSVELEARPGTFVQHFRLDREGAREGEAPLALVRYVAGADPTDGVRVELELDYLAAGVRVLHTEEASPLLRRLVYRELCEGGGRTLFLEGTPEAGFRGYELGGREVVRRAPTRQGEFPLLVVESLRFGLVQPGAVNVLEPLAAEFEPLELATRASGATRELEARRADGSLRWRILARGEELLEWRFQERGPAAQPIAAAEFERLREAHERTRSEAREAAAAARRLPRVR
jgi:hypothetical protein